jgi:hypothetical protein
MEAEMPEPTVLRDDAAWSNYCQEIVFIPNESGNRVDS